MTKLEELINDTGNDLAEYLQFMTPGDMRSTLEISYCLSLVNQLQKALKDQAAGMLSEATPANEAELKRILGLP